MAPRRTAFRPGHYQYLHDFAGGARSGHYRLLNGVGGDEIFGGYRKHLACLKADVYQHLVPGIVRRGLERIAETLPVATGRQGLRYLRWLKRFAGIASLPQAERYLSSDLSLSPAQFQRLFPQRNYHDTWFFRAQQPDLARRTSPT